MPRLRSGKQTFDWIPIQCANPLLVTHDADSNHNQRAPYPSVLYAAAGESAGPKSLFVGFHIPFCAFLHLFVTSRSRQAQRGQLQELFYQVRAWIGPFGAALHRLCAGCLQPICELANPRSRSLNQRADCVCRRRTAVTRCSPSRVSAPSFPPNREGACNAISSRHLCLFARNPFAWALLAPFSWCVCTVKAARALCGRTVSVVATTTARKGARKRNLFFATTVTKIEQVFNDSRNRLGQRP